WHRVALLRPSLVPGLRIVRQQVRDQVWQLLVEPASGKQLRLNPAAYDLVGRLDGRATVSELWNRLLTLRRDEAPTQDEVLQLLDAPRSILIAWICYPVIKLLHELGHALAVRRFGGEVREVGMSLMFLVPAPYVDASAANSFASPRQRVIVSAAGILVETSL